MITDGVPLVVVSHQLGHSFVSTTANIYSHVIAEAEAQAQAAIDKQFENLVTATPEENRKKSKRLESNLLPLFLLKNGVRLVFIRVFLGVCPSPNTSKSVVKTVKYS